MQNQMNVIGYNVEKFGMMLLAAILLMAVSFGVSAAGVASDDDFFEMYEWLERNLTGGLAVGIALVAIIVGAAVGSYNQSAMPMIAGVIIAIFFAFGPAIIVDLIAGSVEVFATVPVVEVNSALETASSLILLK
jgi:type IV secretory pathway VirB2 component (pilin)